MIPKLEVSHLCYSYHTMEGGRRRLFPICPFEVQTGEFPAVVGPSGCGKSTLLSPICGLLKPDSGRILLDGQPVLEGDTRIGYMLQKDHLLSGGRYAPMPVWGWRSRKRWIQTMKKRWKSFLRLMALETLPKPGPRSFPAACASGRPSYGPWPWSRIFCC